MHEPRLAGTPPETAPSTAPPKVVGQGMKGGLGKSLFAPFPAAVWLVALFAAVLHLFPVLRAAAATPEGFEFTGNVTVSPDYMQYRAWMRQTERTGPLVDDRFTAEENRPHLPVLFYWGVGALARAIDVRPEHVYQAAGSLFAFLLALFLFAIVRRFLPHGRGLWCAWLAILFGGGLAGHLKVANQFAALREAPLLGRVTAAVNDAPVFESYRSHYLFKTLFDTHFLLLWLLTAAALFACFAALERFSARRVALAAGLCALITALHVYEAFTLVAVLATIACLCRRRGTAAREARLVALACTAAMGVVLVVLFAIQRRSGLPLPDWKPEDMPFSSLVLAFAPAWVAMGLGFGRWWKGAGLEGTFLVGWMVGCTLLSLSGPYFPYADRAPMTLAIPVWIVAAGAWFSVRERLGAGAGLVLLASLAVSPAYELQRLWKATRFDPKAPTTFLDADHRATIEALRAAGPRDVLLADYREYRWLAPEYPGVLYHGHFFLTVDFERKSRAAEAFFAGDAARREQFLRDAGVRFVFVGAEADPDGFASISELRLVQRGKHGALFEVLP